MDKKKENWNSSLVWQLNMRIFFRMFGMFLAVDIVIAGFLLYCAYYQKSSIFYDMHFDSLVEMVKPFFITLLVAEVIILILNLGSNARMIHRRLKPINELAKTAAKLNKRADQKPEEIKRMKGTLDIINASRLDERISLQMVNDELQPLAAAINGMLERIDHSYTSQMRFVSDASHELRTPISVIQGYANLIDRWGKEDPKTLQESIDAIRNEADSMKDLVEQLLFLARGDNDTMVLELVEVNLSQLCEEVLKEVQMIDQGHSFQAEIQPDIILKADHGLIKQLLRILVDNGMKYTTVEGEIKLSLSCKENVIRIEVQDEGIGIPPEALPYIFDRFYRADESRTRQTGGTGLGLSIANWIVEKHDGHFEVVSREKIGTRFSVIFHQ